MNDGVSEDEEHNCFYHILFFYLEYQILVAIRLVYNIYI
jgi:hypothetical protein